MCVVVAGLLLGGATCQEAATIAPVDTKAIKPVLGPSDLVEVRVFNEPELSGEHRVSDEGAVRLPLVGLVSVHGMSPEDAAKAITDAYNKDYLRDAQVTVLVKEFNSRKVFVLGQVKQPGSYPFEDRMTLIAAIARAGGTSKLARLSAIITRSTQGKTERLEAELGAIRRGEKADVALMPGDIIFVPENPF